MRLLNKMVEILVRNGIIERDDISAFKYGMEIMFSTFLQIISIIVLSVFVGNFVETIFFFLAFIPLRIYAGGYHADSKLKCYIISILVYVFFSITLFALTQRFTLSIILIGEFLTAIVVFTISPVVHKNKRISTTEFEKYRKVCRIIFILEMFFLTIIFFLNLKYLGIAFSLGSITVGISILAALLKDS